MNRLPPMHIGPYTSPFPIIQGGMGVGVSLSGLASAVAEEGGIGVIASVGIGGDEPDFDSNYARANKRSLMREIRKAKAKTSGIIAVNVMAALSDFSSHIEGAVEAQADLVLIGAGLPVNLPDCLPLDDLEQLHTKFVPIVSSARAAGIILKAWARRYGLTPPAIVVEGPLAGGHLGFTLEEIENTNFSLEKLVVEVLNVVRPYEEISGKHIAVIAAGGIYSGADIDRFLRLGADGVQMATRFIATYECDADILFKESIVQAEKRDIVIIESPLGLLGRAIHNQFLDEVETGKHRPKICKWKCLRPCNVKNVKYCIGRALLKSHKGLMADGFAFAGANAYRVKKICSVKDLFQEIKTEFIVARA